MNQHKAHVSQYKKNEVKRVESIFQKYKVIAIADMTNMPSPQLQKLRSTLKDSVFITMAKGRLIKIVLKDLKNKLSGIEKLESYMRGMPALLLTNNSPFKLAKVLKKSKSSAPAKAGQLAPNDIIVPAGPTSFPPGPIIGELGQLKIKAAVVEGKVTVKEDALVVKEGQPITSEVANVLTKLGIEPMEIGINILAAYENGVIFGKEVLTVDEESYINNIKLAARSVFNLTFNIGYTTKDNIVLLVKKAYLDSSALADSRKILTSESVKKELAKANLEMQSLKGKLNLPEETTKEEKPAEPQKEEPKVEAKKEEPQKTETDKEEEVAKQVLKKLQDEKLAKTGDLPKKDKKFEIEEKMAKDVLKKLQDEKMKKMKKS